MEHPRIVRSGAVEIHLIEDKGDLAMRAKILRLTIALITLCATTSAVAGRGLEEVRNRFNEVQSAYDETQGYVNAGNTDSAKEAAGELLDKTGATCTYTQDIKDNITDIPTLQSVWKDVSYWCLELATRTATLKSYLGQSDPKENLSKVTEAFLGLGNSLKAAYEQFNAFGKKWQLVCATCQ
jgi:hypothetical protein